MLRRVLTEQRRFLLPLAIVLAADIAVYAGVVYPLAGRVADASRRSAEAETARRAAQRDFDAAQALATGQQRAESELRTFYEQVLPTDLDAANRSTYLTLSQLARKCNLRITRRQAAREQVRESPLQRWRIGLTLEGSYDDIRRFVHELETTPTFVVIDSMTITQGRDAASPLMLSLVLSTYYRPDDHAS